jgi:hypothetical protein
MASSNHQPKRTRKAGVVLVLASLVVLAFTIPSMASRLDNRSNPIRWASVRTVASEFDYFDNIKGSIEFHNKTATLRWGDSFVEISVPGEPFPGMTDLRGYSQWIAILAMASVERGDIPELEEGLHSGQIIPRLIVVARETPEDQGPAGWGEASTKAWLYRFWELTPDGKIIPDESTHTHKYYGKEVVETGFISYRGLSYMPDTWQFAAAMQVTPSLQTPAARSSSPLSYPNFVNVRAALTAMGWTWPTAGVSILTLIIGGLMFAGSFVGSRRQPQEATPS